MSKCPRILRIMARSLVDTYVAVSEEHAASNIPVAKIICCQWWSPPLHNVQPLAWPFTTLWSSSEQPTCGHPVLVCGLHMFFEHTQITLPLQNEGQFLSHILKFTRVLNFRDLFKLNGLHTYCTGTSCIGNCTSEKWERDMQNATSLLFIPTKCT